MLLFACERLQALSSTAGQKELFDDQLHLLTLLLPDVCTAYSSTSAASSAAIVPQPLLLQQLLPVLIRLSPLMFTSRTSSRPLLVSAGDGDVQSTKQVQFASAAVVVPMLYYAHVLQSMLVLSHIDAAAGNRKRHGSPESHAAASTADKRVSSSGMTDESNSTSQTVAEFEAAQRVALPSLSSISLPLLPPSLVSSSTFVSLLSTCCMADVSCVSSLYLFVLACRLQLITLPRSYSEHVRVQRQRQHAEAHQAGTSTQQTNGARWLSLSSSLSHSQHGSLSASSSPGASRLVSVLSTMTAAFHSQLRCAYVAFDFSRATDESKQHDNTKSKAPDNMEHDWELPSLSSLDHSTNQPAANSNDSFPSSCPLLSPHLLTLLYMWLADYCHSCMPSSPAAVTSPHCQSWKEFQQEA